MGEGDWVGIDHSSPLETAHNPPDEDRVVTPQFTESQLMESQFTESQLMESLFTESQFM